MIVLLSPLLQSELAQATLEARALIIPERGQAAEAAWVTPEGDWKVTGLRMGALEDPQAGYQRLFDIPTAWEQMQLVSVRVDGQERLPTKIPLRLAPSLLPCCVPTLTTGMPLRLEVRWSTDDLAIEGQG